MWERAEQGRWYYSNTDDQGAVATSLRCRSLIPTGAQHPTKVSSCAPPPCGPSLRPCSALVALVWNYSINTAPPPHPHAVPRTRPGSRADCCGTTN